MFEQLLKCAKPGRNSEIEPGIAVHLCTACSTAQRDNCRSMPNSVQAPPNLVRTMFSEAGLISSFAMRAIRLAFQSPFELREVVRQIYMAGWRSLPLVVTSDGLELRDGGVLADVAPTVLQILGLAQPREMTGESLIAG